MTYTGDYSGTESVKYREYAQIPTQLAAPYGYRYVFRESGFVSEWDGYVTGDVTVEVTKTGTLAELDTDYFGEHSALSRIAVSGNKIYGEYYNVLYENTDKALLAKYNGTVVLYADEACTKLLEKDPLFDEYIFGFTKAGESKTYYAQIISEDGINSKVYEIEICFNIAEQLGSIRVSAKGSTITVRYDPSKLKGDPSISVYCQKSNGTSAESILACEGDERFAINRERAIITVSGLRQETEYDVTLIADYGIKNATTFPIESIPTKVITGKDLSKECILTGIADLFSNVVQGATEEDWGEITTANLENSFFEYQIYANVSIGATWELYSSMELKASQIISDKKLALKAGEKNLAYIKVTSEDGEHSRKYKLIIYRQTKAPAPSIAVKDGYAQIYCADGTVAYYTTDKSDPSEINIGVNTMVYESAFAVKDGMLIKAISVDPEHKKYDEESDITKYTVGSSAEEQTYINLKLSDKGSSSFAFSLSSPNVIHGFLVLALYDENGNLADVKIKEVTGASEKINNVNCQNAKSYKAFVVDKLSNLKPISNSVSGAVN